MSERLKRSVGAICICCNIHDRGIKTMADPDWLEVVGHPTIPHVQSLRAPPAQVALHTSKEQLIGLTSQKVSRRYLEKLQKERERNQEVLTECVEHLPMVIRRVEEAERDVPRQQNRFHARPTKANEAKNPFWQENMDEWMKPEHLDPIPSPRSKFRQRFNEITKPSTGRSQERRKTASHASSDSAADSTILNKEFVHYNGFQGSQETDVNNLKYKFGKKKSHSAIDASRPPQFNPKGFGSVYDAIEFERRYKKVYDSNQNVHFVHSNFLTGQRIFKRSRLPPIGHIQSPEADGVNGRDIFAIMSVQKYNHPNEALQNRGPMTSPKTQRKTVHSRFPSPPSTKLKHRLEISQQIDVPVGFVPGTVKSTGNTPFDGVNGQQSDIFTKDGAYKLPLWSCEGDSAIGTLTEETSQSEETGNKYALSATSKRTNTTHVTDDSIAKRKIGKKNSGERTIEKDDHDDQSIPDQDAEPFNISVHVAIKQKENGASGGDDFESLRMRSRQLPVFNFPDYIEPKVGNSEEGTPRRNERNEERVIYPSMSPYDNTVIKENGDKVIKATNISIATNQYGFITHKVQYPERFVLNDSLVEEDEGEEDDSNDDVADDTL
ncbi:hypothetical protein DPMN_004283 [Dreissena polymorpha]|uniref:Uncharacterized protein n=1 Tax=Dreissena polymorpha TaxID=45954 RepID=A0A9D4MR05_DREPO|nr:hypothetical protein DPMN_004283 [Dreissena polymorpha]